ncbi:portal protein [Megasphaera sp. AM44-1BH]|uniref:portal protein n=1 Tax=Megasphaera sp. AM44-1BH TaxID=2292358 RepID=UPI001F2FB9B1|nr:portal protein [Megasphaera sp. AM44-1BH]
MADITTQEMQEQGAKKTYERLKSDRQPYVDRAVDCAKVTIPALFPKENDDKSTKYETPYQSVGARGVNNLASKLILALMPPNSPFFRLGMSDEVLAEYMNNGQEDTKAQVEQALMMIENRVMKYIESNQIRVTVLESIKQLIVAGNALLFLPPAEGGIKLYKLMDYVIQRDGLGNVVQIVTLDRVAYATLDETIQNLIKTDKKPEDLINVYTHVCRSGDNYLSYQEVDEQVIQGSEQTYPIAKTPYIPIRMVKMDGESYGRSFCEEYLGDLNSLENLSKAMFKLSTIAANIYFLVNPNGVTRVKKLENATSGDFVAGRKEDVEVLQLDKYYDFNMTKAQADAIENRLSFAFLLSSVVQRNAERVTAEEVRTVASELEDTLGGVYSILSQELQLPLVRRILNQLQSTGEVPNLPEGTVEPTITTGLEALGRGHDLEKYATVLNLISQIPGAQEMINWNVMLLNLFTGVGVETEGLIKTQQQIEEEQQMAMGQEVAMQAVKEGGDETNG